MISINLNIIVSKFIFLVVFILKRLFLGLIAILVISGIICTIIYMAPVDPARLSFGQRSDETTVSLYKKKYFLDQPLSVQVFKYFEDLSPIQFLNINDLRLEDYSYVSVYKGQEKLVILKKPYFRKSYASSVSVWNLITDALPSTLILSFIAIVLSVLIGMSLGAVCSFNYNTAIDRYILAFCTLGYAIPSYISAIVVSVIFAFVLGHFTHLPIQGSLYEFDDFGNVELRWANVILPALALGIRPVAMICQMTRASLLDVISADYIRTARSKGIRPWLLMIKHILPNAINPILTTISSWFASLLTGAFFVEYVFNYKGLGMLTITAINQYDVPLILGTCIFAIIIFVGINMITDILYRWFDPRIKLPS